MLFEDAAIWDAEPSTPARARKLVEQILGRCGLERSGHPELVATAVLLTSEIVTNAVRYVGGAVSVRARCDDHGLRVEVGDSGPGVPRVVEVVDDATGGRGMHLVDALATQWSTTQVDGGKVVWFELARS
jgi:anti-sigma regulatory factor (Ser/Thr protein kinase)